MGLMYQEARLAMNVLCNATSLRACMGQHLLSS